MIYQSPCPYCGHRDKTEKSGYIRCSYCNSLYELTEPIGLYSSKKLPKYKLLELGENPLHYGFKGCDYGYVSNIYDWCNYWYRIRVISS